MTTIAAKIPAGPRLEEIWLKPGYHDTRGEGICIMELVAWLAGLEHTYFPSCTSPTLADYVTFANDHLEDEPRQQLKELAHDLAAANCAACEEQRLNTLISTLLQDTVCPALRRHGMPGQADDLETALDGADGPLAGTMRRRAIQTAREAEMAAAGASQDENLLGMIRQAHTAAACAWDEREGPPAIYEAIWAGHQAACHALPDSAERAPAIIGHLRRSIQACTHWKPTL